MSGSGARFSNVQFMSRGVLRRFASVTRAAAETARFVGLDCVAAVLAETGGLKVVIGLDDLSEPVLRAAVAAIGVGMKAFHQFLVARLDLGAGFASVEVERVKGPALEVP